MSYEHYQPIKDRFIDRIEELESEANKLRSEAIKRGYIKVEKQQKPQKEPLYPYSIEEANQILEENGYHEDMVRYSAELNHDLPFTLPEFYRVDDYGYFVPFESEKEALKYINEFVTDITKDI